MSTAAAANRSDSTSILSFLYLRPDSGNLCLACSYCDRYRCEGHVGLASKWRAHHGEHVPAVRYPVELHWLHRSYVMGLLVVPTISEANAAITASTPTTPAITEARRSVFVRRSCAAAICACLSCSARLAAM